MFDKNERKVGCMKNKIDIKTNEQWDAAAEILGLKDKDFFGGVENCEFSVKQLSNLLNLGIIMPEQKYNDAPNVQTFYEYGKRAVEAGAAVEYIGFLESKFRNDSRVLIEGIKVTKFNNSTSLILDFSQSFHNADEFTANADLLRAWFD
jgi:hypothetical protein